MDKVDGGAGIDTLSIADTATLAADPFALPVGFGVTNVEKLNVTTNGNIGATATAFDVSTIAGLTDFAGVAAGTIGSNVKVADTTNVSLTVAGNATASVAGGSTVAIVAGAAGTGATSVVGKGLTSVSVKGGGNVTIDNLENTVAATTAIGTTLKAVTLDAVAGATAAVKGAALESLTLQNQKSALTTTVTNATSTKLDVNVNGVGYDAAGADLGAGSITVVAGSKAATINVNATGAKSNLTVTGAVAKTVNITGDAALTLAPVTTATKIDGSTATGALTLGALDAATVNVSTGSGKDSLTLAATAKATVNTGAGDDSLTLGSAVAAGSTINLGAGNDKLLVTTGSVAASTATAITTIDAGDGVDTVAAALINAANAKQFVNFEALDLSGAVANLDVELMTGSTIQSLTLSGRTGITKIESGVSNVAAGVGLTVSGDNDNVDAVLASVGSTTTIGVKGAATGTTDSFTVSFAGSAATTATATAQTAVKAGIVKVDGVEALTVNSTGTGFVTNSIVISDNALKTITITGDKNLDLDFAAGTGGTASATVGVSSIDGSAATGKLDINTANISVITSGLSVKGGSGADTIVLAVNQKATVDAGAGDDKITVSTDGGTLTGGAGNDTFTVSSAVYAATKVVTAITDFAAGDLLVTGAAAAAAVTKLTLTAGVQNIDDAFGLVTAAAGIQWFQYGQDTYVVNNVDTAVGVGATDVAIKLTGLVDLTNASVNADGGLTFA